MLKVLIGWRQHGGSRLDRNLDGKIDDPGAAVMDAAWPKIADAFMRPQLGSQLDELDSLFSRFDQPPGGQYDGWYQYFDRDVRALLGQARGTALPERVLRPRRQATLPEGGVACDRGRRRRS